MHFKVQNIHGNQIFHILDFNIYCVLSIINPLYFHCEIWNNIIFLCHCLRNEELLWSLFPYDSSAFDLCDTYYRLRN